MITAIVLGAVVIILGIIYAIKGHDGSYAVGGAFGGVAICGLLCMAALGIGSCNSLNKWETSTMANLVAMNDGSLTSGDFFLGCGTIDELEYYFFYYETSNGGIKKSKLRTKKVTLYEDDSVKPCVKIHKAKFKNWKYWIFASETSNKRYSIYIPKGSIRRNFALNLN